MSDRFQSIRDTMADAETPGPEQKPAVHPAITHCDNCGCDWLDNGINPVGCPYCKQPERLATGDRNH